jgi:cobalt-zinc-cadmium efflux system outer membrane protein
MRSLSYRAVPTPMAFEISARRSLVSRLAWFASVALAMGLCAPAMASPIAAAPVPPAAPAPAPAGAPMLGTASASFGPGPAGPAPTAKPYEPPPVGGSTATAPAMEPDPWEMEHDADELPRESIALPQIFELLKDKSPRYKAYQSNVDVAKAEIVSARLLPNPVLNLAILYLNAGFNQNGVATYYANVTLPLLLAGQRRMRVKTANTGVKAAEADLAVDYHELAHEARELFVELQAEQARLAVLDEALADLAKLKELMVARRKSGVQTDYDVFRIDIEASAWQARRAELEGELQDTAGHLGVVLGLPGWNPAAEGELALVGVRGDAKQLWPEVERTQPSVVAATRTEAYAAKTIDLAGRERWPVPSVTVGTVAIQNYYSISTQFGITVPLPVFDFGQGMIARAKANRARAKREKEAAVAESEAELERALRQLKHHKHVLEKFDSQVVGKMAGLQTMSEDAFRAGEAEVIDLLDSTRTRFEVKLTRIDLLESAAQAEVDVLAVTGRIEDVAPR